MSAAEQHFILTRSYHPYTKSSDSRNRIQVLTVPPDQSYQSINYTVEPNMFSPCRKYDFNLRLKLSGLLKLVTQIDASKRVSQLCTS